MKNKLFAFTLKETLRQKLVSDSQNLGFPSISAYINELIRTGLPVSESLDLRLQLIEKKIDTLFHDIRTLKGDVNRRTFITFRLTSYILARSFFIKQGDASEDDIKEANKIIEHEMSMFKKRSGDS